jgi:hypothetical protein
MEVQLSSLPPHSWKSQRPTPSVPNLGPHLPQGLQPTLVLATVSAAFGSAFQYGYNIAVVNTPHKVGIRQVVRSEQGPGVGGSSCLPFEATIFSWDTPGCHL